MTMPGGLSKTKIRALSERLRRSDQPDPADIELLGQVLLEFNGAMDEVASRLRDMGLSPTTRLKTSGTIIDKLKRTRLHLGNIRDLAGARVVQRMTLDEQDEAVANVKGIWPEAQVVDRRVTPSFGYRAVHVVPQLGDCQVEIQLRTIYQDTWAQLMETFGDLWGRAIRYGGEPDHPELEGWGGLTRAQTVTTWLRVSDPLHQLAQMENELASLRGRDSRSLEEDQRLADIQGEIDAGLGELGNLIKGLAATLAKAQSGGTEGMVGP
jgi:ppGpp synthetase/RelA/SpoT-type nucleotidyltranferase